MVQEPAAASTATAPARAGSTRLLLIAFTLSGAAALGYELLWTRLLALTLGSELLGVLATLAGFFAGMSVGAVVLQRRAHRARHPARVFAALEAVAAGFALASPHLLHALARWLPALLGPVAGDNDTPAALAASLLIATVVLLPGTLCLGATLPTLVSVYNRITPDDGAGGTRTLARLYAANTIGATAGVLAAVYLVLPRLGFVVGSGALALLGLSAAGLALLWSSKQPTTSADDDAPPDEAELLPPPPVDCSRDPDGELLREPWLLHALAFASGLAGVGLEVVGVQILAQNLENTIYTFANTLAVFLVGTAAGAALYQRLAPLAVRGRPATVTAGLLAALAASTVPAAVALARSPALLSGQGPEATPSFAAAIAGELLAALAVFALPTVLMGALFSHVVGLLSGLARPGEGGRPGRPEHVGRAYALNTLGGAAAPFVFGLWAVPALGYTDGFYAITYLYLALMVGFAWVRRFPARWLVGPAALIIALTAAGPRGGALVLVAPDEGWEVLEQHETLYGVVTVSERTQGPSSAPPSAPLRRLQVGHQFKMGGALSFGEQRMGQLATALTPAPTSGDERAGARALFLGVGTGATMGGALAVRSGGRPVITEAVGVELVPEVLRALPRFADINHDLDHDPRVELHAADARRFLAASTDHHELIVADLFHPARDGAGSLYAREHFASVRARLKPGGVFVQWLPLHQLDLEGLRLITRTFLAAFPEEAHSLLGLYNARTPALALVGRAPEPRAPTLRLDPARLEDMSHLPGATILGARDLLASYMLDRDALARFAGDGPLNEDLHPRVLFEAPRVAYENPRDLGPRNLEALLQARVPFPAALLPEGTDPALLAAARRYAEALTRYLEGELGRERAGGANAPLTADTVEPYLAAYEAAPEFPPARGALYAIASRQPALAGLIFERMLARTPAELRLYKAYGSHLRRVGDEAGLQRMLQRAGEVFGEAPKAPPRTPAAVPLPDALPDTPKREDRSAAPVVENRE